LRSKELHLQSVISDIHLFKEVSKFMRE